MSIAAEIAEKLGALGRDADTVAQTLRNLGVKGKVGGGKCPIFRYLHGFEPRVAWISPHQVHIDHADPCAEHVQLPNVVAEFVECFDAGVYPDLVAS